MNDGSDAGPGDSSDGMVDTDEDGLTLGEEMLFGTNPSLADTDGDGLNDGDEIQLSLIHI